MKDEGDADGNSTRERLSTDSRRQFLSYVAAGTLAGASGLAIGQIIRDKQSSIGRSAGQLIEDPKDIDVFVTEREGDYEGRVPSGETIDSGTNGWEVLRNSIDTVPEGGSILINGRYESSSPINISKSIKFCGNQAVINQRQPGDFALRFHGTERQRTTLAEATTTGATSVKLVNTAGIQQDDLILFKREGADPVLGRGHPPSESHSVDGIDGDEVRLADSIVWRDGYDTETLVYVLDPVEVHVSGLSMQSPAKDGDYYGVSAQICRDSTFEKLRLEKFGSRALLIGPCANARVRNCTVLQSSNIEAADGYGIQIWSGCHDILVEGCTAKDCRHSLSVTAGGDLQVASRAITFRDCFVTGNGSGALNCHGGSAHDVRFEGCTVHTWGDPGLTTGSQQTNVSGCEFRLDGNNAIATRGDPQEAVLTVTDTDVYGATNGVKVSREEDLTYAPLWKFVQLNGVRAYGCNRLFSLGGGKIDRVRELTISDCYWDEVSESGIRFSNRLDGGLIEGNDFGVTSEFPHILARSSSGKIANLEITGNQFEHTGSSGEFIKLLNSEECVISNNVFVADSSVNLYVDGQNSTSNEITNNEYFAPNPPADLVLENDGSVAKANRVYNTASGG